MRQIEPAAAYVPYTTSVGNHEEAYNFSHYTERFTMPGSDHGLFYSFDLGATHFIALSTEFYYFLKYGTDQLKTQYNWLLEDLKVGFERMENLFQDKKIGFFRKQTKTAHRFRGSLFLPTVQCTVQIRMETNARDRLTHFVTVFRQMLRLE